MKTALSYLTYLIATDYIIYHISTEIENNP